MFAQVLSFIKKRKLSEKDGPSPSNNSMIETVARLVIRFLQFVLGVTAAGLYGVRVDQCRKAGVEIPSQWLFAVVVAGLTCVTCIVYCLPKVPSCKAFGWDFVLFIFWMATFGTFAAIYLHRDESKPSEDYEGTNTARMKHSVYVDLVQMLLWFITGAYGTFKFVKARREARSFKEDQV